jgi:hypothetical protein
MTAARLHPTGQRSLAQEALPLHRRSPRWPAARCTVAGIARALARSPARLPSRRGVSPMSFRYRIATAPPRLDTVPVPGHGCALQRWPGTHSATTQALRPRGLAPLFLDARLVAVAAAMLHPRHAERLQPSLLVGRGGLRQERERAVPRVAGGGAARGGGVHRRAPRARPPGDVHAPRRRRALEPTAPSRARCASSAWLLLDEVSMAPASVLAALHGVLTGAPLHLPTGEVLAARGGERLPGVGDEQRGRRERDGRQPPALRGQRGGERGLPVALPFQAGARGAERRARRR